MQYLHSEQKNKLCLHQWVVIGCCVTARLVFRESVAVLNKVIIHVINVEETREQNNPDVSLKHQVASLWYLI